MNQWFNRRITDLFSPHPSVKFYNACLHKNIFLQEPEPRKSWSKGFSCWRQTFSRQLIITLCRHLSQMISNHLTNIEYLLVLYCTGTVFHETQLSRSLAFLHHDSWFCFAK
jgi:hypothetical protein